jgi:hypothetical protein
MLVKVIQLRKLDFYFIFTFMYYITK